MPAARPLLLPWAVNAAVLPRWCPPPPFDPEAVWSRPSNTIRLLLERLQRRQADRHGPGLLAAGREPVGRHHPVLGEERQQPPGGRGRRRCAWRGAMASRNGSATARPPAPRSSARRDSGTLAGLNESSVRSRLLPLAADEEGVGLGQRQQQVLPAAAGGRSTRPSGGPGCRRRGRSPRARSRSGTAAWPAVVHLAGSRQLAGQLGHAGERAVDVGAEQLAAGVDRLPVIGGAVQPHAVEVLEAEADGIEGGVAGAAQRDLLAILATTCAPRWWPGRTPAACRGRRAADRRRAGTAAARARTRPGRPARSARRRSRPARPRNPPWARNPARCLGSSITFWKASPVTPLTP